MFETQAIVKSSPRKDDGTLYIIAEIDRSIGDYYRAVVKWLSGVKLNSPLYNYHITIVSGKHEQPIKMHDYIDGAVLRIGYDQRIYNYGPRYILPIYDVYGDVGNFRESLGLTRERKNVKLHMTIGYNDQGEARR
jgi:hypothetical protein